MVATLPNIRPTKNYLRLKNLAQWFKFLFR